MIRSLNLGCGDRYVDGWWNVDHAGSPHRRDETVDLTGSLPWAADSFDRVYIGHLLEHLNPDDCVELLARLVMCVVRDGRLMVVGPDVPDARRRAVAGTLDVTLDSLVHGGNRWSGDEHHWECSPRVVAALLRYSGWFSVTMMPIYDVPDEWPVADRRPTWQFGVGARRRQLRGD